MITSDSTHGETQLDLRDQVRQALQIIRTEAGNLAIYRLNDEARQDAAAAIDRSIDRIDALLSPSPETEEGKAKRAAISKLNHWITFYLAKDPRPALASSRTLYEAAASNDLDEYLEAAGACVAVNILAASRSQEDR